MRVYRFAAGVGKPPYGWMDAASEELNVQSVDFDNKYYVCMEEWTNAINAA